MIFKMYKTCICPHCYEISNTYAEKTFRCVYCRKSTKFQYKKKIGLQVRVVFHTDNPTEAITACSNAKLKMARGGYQLIR